MNKKPTVTIGIPAYNEEANIGNLLKSLLKQKQDNFVLKEIIVVSDASTDDTHEVVNSFKNKKIQLIGNEKRVGKNVIQNQIFKLSDTEFVLLLDADVRLSNKNFIDLMAKTILTSDKIGIVGANTESINGNSFFERIISFSHTLKTSLYFQMNDGNNIYLCHGRARIFSKEIYEKLKWPKCVPEDAYSYLYCVDNNKDFRFQPSATVIFRSPDNFLDHHSQSNRFFYGKKELHKYFSRDFIGKELQINKSLLTKVVIKSFLKFPTYTLGYLIILVVSRFTSFKKTENLDMWKHVSSSKQFNLKRL